MISIVVTLLWFNNGSLALGGDFASIPFDPARTASRYLSSWNFWIDGGNPIPTALTNQVPPLDFLFYFLSYLANLPLAFAQGVYIILFSYFVAAASTYSLVRTLFDSKLAFSRLAGLVSGIFAILNPIYVYSSGYPVILGSAISRASLPLGLFLIAAGVKKRNLRYAMALGLTTILMFSVFERAIEIGFLILMTAILALPLVVDMARKRTQVSLKFVGRFFGISAFIAIAVNLFWIIPFLTLYPVFYQKLATYPLSIVAFESQFTTIQNILRLQGYWAFYVGNYVPYSDYYSNPIIFAITFLLPAIAVGGGLLAGRRCQREVIGLALLLVVLLALSLGTNLPFGIFSTLIQSVSYFKLFKDPWVFLEPLSIVYSVLFGASMALLAGFLAKKVKIRYFPIFASLAVAMLVLGTISGPVVSGAVFVNWYQPSQRGVAVPPEYAQLNNWIMQDNSGFTTMMVPELTGSYVATTWGFQGPNVLYQNLFSTKLITGSGPAIYGLEPSAERQFLSYVYTLMSEGNPLFSPLPINATDQGQDWHFSVNSQTNTDSIGQQQSLTPWNESALVWNFGPNSEGAQNGHSIYFRYNGTQDLSQQRWALIWAYSSTDWTNLVFGIGDASGNVAWYPLNQHELFASGEWTLFGFPLNQPDVRTSNLSTTTSFFLDYGLFLGRELAGAGNGTVSFGPILLSTGAVPASLMQFLLAKLNVKYLVMDQSIDSNLYPQLDLKPYESMLALWPQISLVKTFGPLLVYQNSNFGSLISIPRNWIQTTNLYLLPQAFNATRSNTELSGFIVGAGSDLNATTSNVTLDSVSQTGPTSFTIQLSGTGTAVVVLSTAFDPNWAATHDGQNLGSHMLANGYANAWSFNESGNMTIQLQYQLQSTYDASLWASFISIFVVSEILAFPKLVSIWRKFGSIALRLRKRWT